MKNLIGLILFVPFLFACNGNTSQMESRESELTDTLMYKKIVLHVEGMTCEGCEKAVQKGVGGLIGVTEVKASHTDSVATIVFDTSQSSVVMISEKINELGYAVVNEITPIK